MLKLVDAISMSYDSVLEYYNSFDNKYEINNFEIMQVVYGKEKYYSFLIDYIAINGNSIYYLIDTDNYNYIIGYGCIDDFDYQDTGNIGYGVRPNERNKGYGTKLLELLKEKCEGFGMRKLYVSCAENNKASQKVILNNGGSFEKVFNNEVKGQGLRYKIKLKK